MKKSKLFKNTFSAMKIEPAKKWDITIPKVVHKDKKKELNKKFCRKGVDVNG